MTDMKVVAFDLDDTLVPEALFIRSGIRHIASYLAERHPSLSERRIITCMDTAVFTRRNHYSALEQYLESMRIPVAKTMTETVQEFRSHKPDPAIYHLAPSTEGILEHLKSCGIKLALVTDGRSVTQRNKIAAAGLQSYFDDDDIYISGETWHDKNDPDSFLAIMRKHAGADEYHYVGDNPEKDVRQPMLLGWQTHLVHPFPLAVHRGL